MATRKFRCSRCDRTFSMAAHLVRHQNAMHGMGGRGRGGRGAAGARRTGRGRGRPTGRPAAMRITGLGDAAERIISEMSAYRDGLLAQRESISVRISGIEGAMSALGTGAMIVPDRPGRGRGRGPRGRTGSLKPMVVQVLRQRGTPMSPQQIAEAVIKAGYKTKTSNLTKAVSNALPDIREVKRVDRGQYSA